MKLDGSPYLQSNVSTGQMWRMWLHPLARLCLECKSLLLSGCLLYVFLRQGTLILITPAFASSPPRLTWRSTLHPHCCYCRVVSIRSLHGKVPFAVATGSLFPSLYTARYLRSRQPHSTLAISFYNAVGPKTWDISSWNLISPPQSLRSINHHGSLFEGTDDSDRHLNGSTFKRRGYCSFVGQESQPERNQNGRLLDCRSASQWQEPERCYMHSLAKHARHSQSAVVFYNFLPPSLGA